MQCFGERSVTRLSAIAFGICYIFTAEGKDFAQSSPQELLAMRGTDTSIEHQVAVIKCPEVWEHRVTLQILKRSARKIGQLTHQHHEAGIF